MEKISEVNRYRFSFCTKEMIDEMIFVIPASGPVLLSMMKNYTAYLQQSITAGDPAGEKAALDLIGSILHIFYSLNCVNLPEFFEDTMKDWVAYFKSFLEYKGVSECSIKCKTRIIKSITLYCEKYAPDFKDYLFPFFNLIWSQVGLLTIECEYDKVNSSFIYSLSGTFFGFCTRLYITKKSEKFTRQK